MTSAIRWLHWSRRYFRYFVRNIYQFLVETCSAGLMPYEAVRCQIITKIPHYHDPNACFSILHLGCGTGSFANRLRHERGFALYTGVDQYPAFVRQARRKLRKKHPNYLFFRSKSYCKLAVAKASQDIVICSENPFRYAKELYRVLKPDGYVLAAIPIPGANLGPIIKEHLKGHTSSLFEAAIRQFDLLPIRLLYFFDLCFGITARSSTRSLYRKEIVDLYGIRNGLSTNAHQTTLVKISRYQLYQTLCEEHFPFLATLAA